jgi:Secretion system C-terminal sorting domain
MELSEAPRGNTKIHVMDALGQVIYSNVVVAQSTYYDFSYLRAGTYYIQVIGTEASFTKTIIITQGY